MKIRDLVDWIYWLTGWTQRGRDEIFAIAQMKFSNVFSWMKMYEFRLPFHLSLFLNFELTIFQHWFRWWLGAEQAMLSLSTHVCVTRPQWVNVEPVEKQNLCVSLWITNSIKDRAVDIAKISYTFCPYLMHSNYIFRKYIKVISISYVFFENIILRMMTGVKSNESAGPYRNLWNHKTQY